MPTHIVLSSAEYLDQFCFIVSCAAVSSARQDSLLRPRMIAPCPAASQLGPTWSVGGPSAPPRLVLSLRSMLTFWPSCVGGFPGCCSLWATSGGRSFTVGCRCPTGACGVAWPVVDGRRDPK